MTHAVPCADSPATRLATRLAFFVSGFGMACWAPLVPYAKARLDIGEAVLGLLLLFLGAGSMLSMPVAGVLAGRIGARPVILVGGVGLCCAMPLLAGADFSLLLALALALFGASLGAMDVAMNIHAVEVANDAPVPLMSGFHGLFSLGGFVGSLGMTGLLAAGLAPLPAILVALVVVITGLALAAPRLLRTRSAGSGPLFVVPRGLVLLLGALTFAMFLAEGALLDWGAILLVGLGAANIVPVLFSAAGRQGTMPANLAVAAVTTVGYAGVLAGPALVGFVAQGLGLVTAFVILGVLMLSAPLTARWFVR
ncbi:hypothetical protein B6S59_05095 [Pseudomonas sp. A46]|nr:MFS transporter [Pseudomonas sp. A46]OWJ97119.1 hypothetical protein B6S59_05095 [Pseudomonas sp. A46]